MDDHKETPKFVKEKVAKQILGVNGDTLRRWADNNKIPYYRSEGGTRLYNVDLFLKQRSQDPKPSTITNSIQSTQSTSQDQRANFCYCRVSSSKQKEDLQRQIQDMQRRFPNHVIISDIGSGINWKRKGLRQLLDYAHQKRVKQIVVAYRDRLCRFAFELLEWVFQLLGVELVVLNQAMDSSEPSELAEDLLAIITVFSCRANGTRKYKKGKIQDNSEQSEEKQETSSKQNEEN